MKRYVLGFAFTRDRRHVVLIEKTKPAWQAGKLNGVGGKVEDGETYAQAMMREFTEETGFIVGGWRHYATLAFDDAEMAVFETTFEPPTSWFCTVEWPTEETPTIVDTSRLPKNTMTNLRWLIPMASDVGFEKPLMVTYSEDNNK